MCERVGRRLAKKPRVAGNLPCAEACVGAGPRLKGAADAAAVVAAAADADSDSDPASA